MAPERDYVRKTCHLPTTIFQEHQSTFMGDFVTVRKNSSNSQWWYRWKFLCQESTSQKVGEVSWIIQGQRHSPICLESFLGRTIFFIPFLLLMEKNPAAVEVDSLTYYSQSFIHPRWCSISSMTTVVVVSTSWSEVVSEAPLLAEWFWAHYPSWILRSLKMCQMIRQKRQKLTEGVLGGKRAKEYNTTYSLQDNFGEIGHAMWSYINHHVWANLRSFSTRTSSTSIMFLSIQKKGHVNSQCWDSNWAHSWRLTAFQPENRPNWKRKNIYKPSNVWFHWNVDSILGNFLTNRKHVGECWVIWRKTSPSRKLRQAWNWLRKIGKLSWTGSLLKECHTYIILYMYKYIYSYVICVRIYNSAYAMHMYLYVVRIPFPATVERNGFFGDPPSKQMTNGKNLH